MKKLKRVKVLIHTGTYNVDYVNISACLLMIIYSTIDYIIKDVTFAKYFLYILPYAIYPMVSIIVKSKKVTAILYLIVGFITLLLDPDNNGISGLLYIYFSYNELKNNIWSLLLLAISYISLTGRFILLSTEGSEAVISILLFTFIFATLYIKVIKENTNLSKLPEEIKAILKLYCNGYNYEKISMALGLGVTSGTVRRKITAFMNKNDIKNDAQLGKWLHRNV